MRLKKFLFLLFTTGKGDKFKNVRNNFLKYQSQGLTRDETKEIVDKPKDINH